MKPKKNYTNRLSKTYNINIYIYKYVLSETSILHILGFIYLLEV